MISIGSKEMVDCQVGSKKVKEIYVGDKQVWPSWTLLYEDDVKAGGFGTVTLATIPNFVSGTTKIKVVVSYVTGTWETTYPATSSGQQALSFGVPPTISYVEFNADVSPLSIQFVSGNTDPFMLIDKASTSTAFAQTSFRITEEGKVTKTNMSPALSLFSDPVHLQVYYQ